MYCGNKQVVIWPSGPSLSTHTREVSNICPTVFFNVATRVGFLEFLVLVVLSNNISRRFNGHRCYVIICLTNWSTIHFNNCSSNIDFSTTTTCGLWMMLSLRLVILNSYVVDYIDKTWCTGCKTSWPIPMDNIIFSLYYCKLVKRKQVGQLVSTDNMIRLLLKMELNFQKKDLKMRY